MKTIFTRVSLIVGLAALLSLTALAQTTAPQDGTVKDEGRGGRRGRAETEGRMGGLRGARGRHAGAPGRALSRLNLSDAQRTQMREIEARYGQSLRAQRQEMRGLFELRREGATLTPEQQQRAEQLRGELRDSAERMHTEILALLTPEQRDQLKRMREEMEARRKARREGFTTPDEQ
ncbi:MAG TPA: Spy/CpxP family protein refolding chaperone [Pyrinomonadaceae bacterium]|nr:Spy/CpxP family protein refolding chaperone [Pyrinomonadaceae bacterium]